MEQKILALVQIRVGPNYAGYWGVFQPFADAIKLFSKEGLVLRSRNLRVYFLSPALSLGLRLVLWISLPIFGGGINFLYSLFFFMVVRGVGVYPILRAGWRSNCKYSMLGSLRAVAQIVSYEVRLAMVLLSLIWVIKSYNISDMLGSGLGVFGGLFFFPLTYVWFLSRLAETNRTPYDFSEGESELVSGFNTEYRAGGFTLIFMAEYANILFMGVLFSIFFISDLRGANLVMLKGVLVRVWFIWVRGRVPRYRYDKLIGLAWKRLLPITLSVFLYYGYIWADIIFWG